MARIGDVWDSTTDVLAGRAGLIAPLVAAAVFVPQVVQRGVKIFGGASPGAAVLVGLVGLLAVVLNLWAGLAVVAIASDPATTRAEAGRLAWRRLPANILVVVVLGGLATLLVLPGVLALAATGFDFAAAGAASGAGGTMPAVAPAAGVFLFFYSLLVLVLILWATARLFLVNPVVLNERLALGALARSVRLTRGLTWKLIGVVLVFGVVLLIASSAAGQIVGLTTRLALGPDQVAVAQFMAAVASAAVQAAFAAVVQVFAARLYAAVTGGISKSAP